MWRSRVIGGNGGKCEWTTHNRRCNWECNKSLEGGASMSLLLEYEMWGSTICLFFWRRSVWNYRRFGCENVGLVGVCGFLVFW